MFHLELRPKASKFMRYFTPVLAIFLTLLSGVFIFTLLGKSPLDVFQIFLVNPFKNTYALAELFLKATPLMLIALGLTVSFQANVWNIGAEGQYIMGAVFATFVALYLPISSHFLMITLMVIAGVLGGMFWAAIPAFLKTKMHTNEILVSLMLVYVAQFFASWLVYIPWQDPEGHGFPQTKIFDQVALLPIIFPDTRLNLAFVFALFFLVLGYILLFRSHLGFQLKVLGRAQLAARYAGFSTHAMIWLGLLISGAMAGLAGMAEVAGPAEQLTEHISNRYGFAAIIVAFVGRLHPFGIFLASLLMSVIYIGGEQAQQYLNLPSSIGMIFQGLLLLFLLSSDILITYRVRFS